MKKSFVSFVIVLQFILVPSLKTEAAENKKDDSLISISSAQVKAVAWITLDVGCWVGAWYSDKFYDMFRAISLFISPAPGVVKALRVTRWGLVTAGVGLPILYFYFRNKNSVLVSKITPDDLKEQFLNIKEKRLAWEVAPDNVFLKLDYLSERKLYHTLAIDLISEDTDYEDRKVVLEKLESDLLSIEDEIASLDETVLTLSSSVKQDLFAQKVSLQEEVLTPEVRMELAQKLESALLTLQGAI